MTDFVSEIVPVNIEDELRQSYLDYAMSVIVGRALPDVRERVGDARERCFDLVERAHLVRLSRAFSSLLCRR